MDRFSYMIDSQHRFLLIGIVVLVVATMFTLTGQSLAPFGRMVNRPDEPRKFWQNVAICYFCGVLFIGLYLYNTSN